MKKNLIYTIVTLVLSSLYFYWQEPANFCFTQECLYNTLMHVGKDIFLVLFGLNSVKPTIKQDAVINPLRLQ